MLWLLLLKAEEEKKKTDERKIDGFRKKNQILESGI